MRYRTFGDTGLRVSELCLGTMTFGEAWGWGAAEDVCRQQLDIFFDRGGNFIDTANMYTNGESEQILGKLLGSRRDRIVLGTKYSMTPLRGDPNAGGNHRKNLIQSLEESLRRLKTDYIDIYWLHAWDGLTPVEEVGRTFDDMVRAGKIRYAAISNTPAWRIAQANTIARLRGWTSFNAIQAHYNLIDRTPERELLPLASAFRMTVMPYSPLASGWLTGKYLEGGQGRMTLRGNVPSEERRIRIAKEVQSVAAESGMTAAQVALTWLRGRPGNMIPVLGARNVEQLQEALGCLDCRLDPEHRQRLDEITELPPGHPHDTVRGKFLREHLYGGLEDKIERP